MSRRQPGGPSIFGSPVLVGSLTVLIVIVAVFLAYNANSGLPFVPTYELKAQVPSAERERVRIVLSMGSGWTLLSSFIVRIAIAPPPRCRTGLTKSTAPTRWPPIRTSLPGTRFAALGTWALSS